MKYLLRMEILNAEKCFMGLSFPLKAMSKPSSRKTVGVGMLEANETRSQVQRAEQLHSFSLSRIPTRTGMP
jgi:hypothetical protein